MSHINTYLRNNASAMYALKEIKSNIIIIMHHINIIHNKHKQNWRIKI